MLRSKGVQVVEYESDYGKAVEEGRKNSDADPMSYFVDDEKSMNLFLGYTVAASRIKKQFDERGIVIDKSILLLFIFLVVLEEPLVELLMVLKEYLKKIYIFSLLNQY